MARNYELGKRAETQRRTRQRIVEATVELHRTVGPARTTISKIAELAGVERKTFYRHFPNPDDVLKECSLHYRTLNPPPDPRSWLEIAEPHERLRHGLLACYRYYRRNQPMMSNILRDRAAGFPVGDGFLRHRAAATQALMHGLALRGRRRTRTEAAITLALDFHTWQILADAGLSDHEATELASLLPQTSSRRVTDHSVA